MAKKKGGARKRKGGIQLRQGLSLRILPRIQIIIEILNTLHTDDLEHRHKVAIAWYDIPFAWYSLINSLVS
jgi:hypothetical protein